jgi:hypothetical protein
MDGDEVGVSPKRGLGGGREDVVERGAQFKSLNQDTLCIVDKKRVGESCMKFGSRERDEVVDIESVWHSISIQD